MTREFGMPAVHDILINMLSAIDAAARASGARYFLAYGTALGAAREGDLIPWDTDADVLVPVEDYALLLSAIRRDRDGPFVVVDSTTSGYEHLFARLAIEGVDHNLVHVDIFPLAGASSSAWIRWVEVRTAKLVGTAYMLRVSEPARRFHYSPKKERRARWAGLVLSTMPTTLWSFAFRCLSRRPTTDHDHVYNPSGSYTDREVLPASMITGSGEVTLRGKTFVAPRELAAYLTHTYGDYHRRPPLEEQRAALAFFESATLPRLVDALTQLPE
jgi:lipopolysaccharide cholinephosphotransferase